MESKIVTIKCTKSQKQYVKLIKQKYDLSNKQLFNLILKTLTELINNNEKLVKKQVTDSSISFRTNNYLLYRTLLIEFKKNNPDATTNNLIDKFIEKF